MTCLAQGVWPVTGKLRATLAPFRPKTSSSTAPATQKSLAAKPPYEAFLLILFPERPLGPCANVKIRCAYFT